MKGGIFERNGCFYANVWHPVLKRKIKERVGPNKAEALARAAQLKARFITLSSRPFGGRVPTLSEYIPVVLEQHYSRLAARSNAVRALNYFLEFAGDQRLDQITRGVLERYKYKRLQDFVPPPFKTGEVDPEKIESWRRRNQKKIRKSTINREVEIIKRMMNHAVENEILEQSPVASVKKYGDKETRQGESRRYLLDEELRRLREACKRSRCQQLLAVVDIAIHTARRRSDILKLRVDQYDRRNGMVYLANTKHGAPQWIPVPRQAQEILDRLVAAGAGPWFFPGRDGTGPVKDVDTAFNVAKKRAGLPWLRFHDLRHSGISYMVMAAIDLKTIAEQVGHTSAVMIDKRYGHLSPKHRAASAVAFGAFMERLLSAAPVA